MKIVKFLFVFLLFVVATNAMAQTGTYDRGDGKPLKMRPIKAGDRGVQWPPFGGLAFQIVTADAPDVYGGSYEAIGILFSKPELCKVGKIAISGETGLILLLYSADSGAAESGNVTITKKNGNLISGTFEAKIGNYTFKGTFENISI